MVKLIIIPIKWLFHWEYTLFSDIPMWCDEKPLKKCMLELTAPGFTWAFPDKNCCVTKQYTPELWHNPSPSQRYRHVLSMQLPGWNTPITYLVKWWQKTRGSVFIVEPFAARHGLRPMWLCFAGFCGRKPLQGADRWCGHCIYPIICMAWYKVGPPSYKLAYKPH